jgi:CHAD domain-containing protein
MTSHLEIEHKYDIEPGVALPGLTGLPGGAKPGEPETHTLIARYFDTEDLRLASRGITLRHRRGGPDDGWHLKFPAGPGARRELREPPGQELVVPARFATLVAAHTRGWALVPVATLQTRRTVIPLRGADGAVLAEVADDEVRGRPVTGPEQVWREIEVELGTGSDELLEAAGDLLRAAGARPARASSKLGRLLSPPPTPAPRGYRTAGDLVTSYVAAQLETILEYDPRVRQAEYDSVHKTRVAVRRIRSILRTAARLLDPDRTPWLETELKWLAGELGEVRDLEVLRERFAGRLAALGAASPPWMAGLEAKERLAYQRLRRTLLADRYFTLLDALEAFVADPPVTERAGREAREAAPALVARAWRRVADRHAAMEHAERERADALDEARHRTRKAAKRARYTAEAARPVLGEPARRLAVQAERVQETLGAYQDSVIARERLAELDTGGEEARVIGVLIDMERKAADQALLDVRMVWKEAADPEYVRALTD